MWAMVEGAIDGWDHRYRCIDDLETDPPHALTDGFSTFRRLDTCDKLTTGVSAQCPAGLGRIRAQV